MLFLHVTSRIPGRKNDGMLSQKGGRGFPHMVWMDASGTVLAKQGARSIAGFTKTGNAVKKYMELKAAGAEGGNANALFLAELELGKLEWQAAVAKAKTLTLSDEEKAQADKLIFNLEVGHKFGQIRRARGANRQAAMQKLGAEFAEHFKAGKFPTDDIQAYYYSVTIIQHAKTTSDAKLAKDTLAKLKAQAGSNPMFKRVWPNLEKQVASIQAQ